MRKLKLKLKSILPFAVLGAALSSVPTQAMSVGAQIGDFDAVTVRADGWQIDIGFDTFGLGVSRVYSLIELNKQFNRDVFYGRLGGRYMDSDHREFGIEGALGAQTHLSNIQVFAELVPTLWLVNDIEGDVGLNVGFRVPL